MLTFRFDGSMPFFAGSPGVPAACTLFENLLCVGLPYRGMALAVGVPMLGLAAGVNCSLRTGDSGRSEARGFLDSGLVARPGGPTDLLNWEAEGVGGVLVEFWVPALNPPVAEAGVMGKELVAELGGESRLTALLSGRNMPAPATVVVK